MTSPGNLTVVHIKDSLKTENTASLYIGRGSPKSPKMENAGLGNPFTVKQYGRGKAAEAYRPWLWKQYNENPAVKQKIDGIVERIKAGENIELVCFCKPKPCHGDMIKRLIDYMIEKERK